MHLVDKNARIYVAGHRGLVGSALVRRLRGEEYDNLILRTREEVDLTDQSAVDAFFDETKPEFVILAAARVGGILANDTYPADFISENLAIQTNVIRAAHRTGTSRLIFLGSSCIYPRDSEQPIKEEYLLTGPLEPTNQWYAVAKIAGLKLCEAYRKQYGSDFISLMPTNLYGPGDNFDLKTSHVLPALIRKFHEAKREDGKDAPVMIWGTGTPRREFLYSDDLADAVVHVLKQPSDAIEAVAPDAVINVGTGEDIQIRELAAIIRDIVGSKSEVVQDTEKPDGTPRKRLDVSRLKALGWSPRVSLQEGIRRSYASYLRNRPDTTP